MDLDSQQCGKTNLVKVENIRIESREVEHVFGEPSQCQLEGHHLKAVSVSLEDAFARKL